MFDPCSLSLRFSSPWQYQNERSKTANAHLHEVKICMRKIKINEETRWETKYQIKTISRGAIKMPEKLRITFQPLGAEIIK